MGRQRASIAANTAALVTAVLGSESKTAFIIAKSAALAQVAISTGLALAAVPAQTAAIPFPSNLAAAGTMTSLIKANAGLQVATIAATAIRGFQEGGVVGGTISRTDNQTIRAAGGEMVLTRRQQAELFSQANGRGGSSGGDIVVNIESLTGTIPEEQVNNLIQQISDQKEFRNA